MINNSTTLTINQLSDLVEHFKNHKEDVIHNYIRKTKIDKLSIFEMRFIYMNKQLDVKIELEYNGEEITNFAFMPDFNLTDNRNRAIEIMKDFANECLLNQ